MFGKSSLNDQENIYNHKYKRKLTQDRIELGLSLLISLMYFSACVYWLGSIGGPRWRPCLSVGSS